MVTKYPISEELRRALVALFSDPTVPEGLLGGDLRDKGIEARRTSQSAEAKVLDLKGVLEGYICNMAKEVDELGAEETPRLKAEACGLFVALRELAFRFPGVVLGGSTRKLH
jgi:hypothetical protein